MVLFVACETRYICLMWEASFENFCMILVWVLRNHTNHIWPSKITKKKIFFYPLCIFDCYFLRISNQEQSGWSLLRVDFIFCMILVWLPRNHTNHIWPSTVTRKHIWPSTKSKKVVWSMTRVDNQVKNANDLNKKCAQTHATTPSSYRYKL